MKRSICVMLAGAALLPTGAALAQTPAQPLPAAPEETAANETQGDIVVTAQKRSESLQKVPISITALTGEQLERQQIKAASDLSSIVPNLQVSSPLGDATPIFALRGVTQIDFGVAQNGPVAVYYDEVYHGNLTLLGVGLYDLERVEVLKGPQGTLYGKNTTGGAINLIARVPDFTSAANISASYGNYNAVLIEGGAQTALTDTLAVRGAFTFGRARGWFKNDAPDRANLESTRQYALRGTAVWEPGDAFHLTVRAATSFQNPTAYGVEPIAALGGIGSPGYPAPGAGGVILNPITQVQRRHGFDDEGFDRRSRTYSLAATADVKLSDQLSIVSITSWDKGSLFLPEDTDGTALRIAAIQVYGRMRQVTQDLRLVSDFDGPLNFILGGYYGREKLFSTTNNNFFADIDLNGDGILSRQDCIDGGYFAGCQFSNRFDQIKTSLAVYSDATFALSDRVKLRGGLRYTHDKGDLKNFSSILTDQAGVLVLNLVPDVAGQTASLQFRDQNVSGKIGIDFDISRDALIYAKFSTGYRGSAFNGAAYFSPAELSVAKPETLKAYELGFKTELFDRLVRFNGAVFYYDYKNQQSLDYNSQTQAQIVVNLPKSRVKGAEFDLAIRPAPSLTLTSSLGLLDAKITRATVQGIDVSGNRSTNAPRITLSGGLDWDIPVGTLGTLEVHGDTTYTSRQYFDVLNNPNAVQDSYVVMNGRLRLALAGARYGIAIWAKNLNNAHYRTSMVDATAGYGFTYAHVNAPRTFGASVDANF